MTTFTIIYELNARRFETSVEHWTQEDAREKFEDENPGAVILEIYEED